MESPDQLRTPTIPVPPWWLEAIDRARAGISNIKIAEMVTAHIGRPVDASAITRCIALQVKRRIAPIDLVEAISDLFEVPRPVWFAGTEDVGQVGQARGKLGHAPSRVGQVGHTPLGVPHAPPRGSESSITAWGRRRRQRNRRAVQLEPAVIDQPIQGRADALVWHRGLVMVAQRSARQPLPALREARRFKTQRKISGLQEKQAGLAAEVEKLRNQSQRGAIHSGDGEEPAAGGPRGVVAGRRKTAPR